MAILTAASGAAPLAIALSGRSVNLPNVALDPEAVRGTAAALGVFVVAIGVINAVCARGVSRGSARAWAGAVVSSGLTATWLFATLLGLVFQRGAGAQPWADAASIGVGLVATAYAVVCALIAARGARGDL